jgi:hypothetical protein
MRKKISLVIVFSILLLALISIGPPVKAKQEIQQTEYEAIDIYGNQLPNSKYQNGLYEKGLLISPYDFIFTDLNEEQKENAFYEYSGYNEYMYYFFNGTDEEIEIAKENFILRTGLLEDGTYNFPFFYITSLKEFEAYLIDSGYIREGENYKDIDVSEFGSRLEILQRLEEKKLGYLISKKNIPGYFYQSSYISSNTNILELNIIYKIDELYDFYILNNKFSYTNSSSSDDLIYEKSELTLPDSFGKIKAISANKFIYEYSILRYNNEFGYFGLVQDDEIYTIELNINQVPSFLFDSKGNLKDDYVSFKSGYWYLVRMQIITDKIIYDYLIRRENYYVVNVAGASIKYNVMVAYLSFRNFDEKIVFDTIEEIEFCYSVYREYELFPGITIPSKRDYYDLTCILKKNREIDRPVFPDGPFVSHTTSFEDMNFLEIQKGDYYIQLSNGKEYNLNYKLFLSSNIQKYIVNPNNPFAFYDDIYPTQELQIMNIICTYKSVVFSLKNLEGNNLEPIVDKEPEYNCSTFLKDILNGIKVLWNWNYPIGMFIILGFLAVCVILIIIYFPGLFKVLLDIIIFPFKILIKLFLSLINFFKKKKE